MGLCRLELVVFVLSLSLLVLSFVQGEGWIWISNEEADRILQGFQDGPAADWDNNLIESIIGKPDGNPVGILIDEPMEPIEYPDYDEDDTKSSVSLVMPSNNQKEPSNEEIIEPSDYSYYDINEKDNTKSSPSLFTPDDKGDSNNEGLIELFDYSYVDISDKDDNKSSASLAPPKGRQEESLTDESIEPFDYSHYYDEEDDTEKNHPFEESIEPFDHPDYDIDEKDDTNSSSVLFKTNSVPVDSPTDQPIDYSYYDFEDKNETESSVFLVKPDSKPGASLFDESTEPFEYYDYDFDNDNENTTKSSHGKGNAEVEWTPRFFETDTDPDYDAYEDVEEEILDDPTGFEYECIKGAFKISLFKDQLDKLQVIDSDNALYVDGLSPSCGVLNKTTGTFVVPFNGCFTTQKKSLYSVRLLLNGTEERRATCFAPESSPIQLTPRGGGPSETRRCRLTTTTPPTTPTPPPPQPRAPAHLPKCDLNIDERVRCNSDNPTEAECIDDGCCWDPSQSTKRCYYPKNECTKDGRFVFTIRYDDAAPLLIDTSTLVIPNTDCAPEILTPTTAVYAFPQNECGTVYYSFGSTSVWLAEVRTTVETINYRYGVISRDNDIRFLIECRHSDGDTVLTSTSYMVTTSFAPVPSAIISNGLYGVQLSIAKDHTYTDFYKTYHPPLKQMLGKPLYFQLLLLSPTPEANLEVNYCVAYPRHSDFAAPFIYEGCPNPKDLEGVGIFRTSDFNGERHEKRFWIETFQFRDADKYLDEDLYFMCSTKVSFIRDGPTPQQCFNA